jgi:hypothetical protein
VEGKNKAVFECILVRDKKTISDNNQRNCEEKPILKGILTILTPHVPNILNLLITDQNLKDGLESV